MINISRSIEKQEVHKRRHLFQEEYLKIGLRRLQIRDEYKGETLTKEPRTFETEKITEQNYMLNLFEA